MFDGFSAFIFDAIHVFHSDSGNFRPNVIYNFFSLNGTYAAGEKSQATEPGDQSRMEIWK